MNRAVYPVIAISLIVAAVSLGSLRFLRSTERSAQPGRSTPVSADTRIRVAVLNGCGRGGLASEFAERLRSFGFDVVNGIGENADSFEFPVSVVVDRADVPDRAAAVAAALGIDTVLRQRADDPYIIEEVQVILGRDWHTLHTPKEESAE